MQDKRLFSNVATIAVLTSFLALAAHAQPTAPRRSSNWNLLVEGGKGVIRTASNCHPLDYFAGSPLLFDFEQDFYQANQSDLQVTNELKHLGTAEGRLVVQILQRVHDARRDSDMVSKRLVVQRTNAEFCAIYQQVYAAAQVDVKTARLLTLDGKPVLKTMDQNGNAKWNEEYWTFAKDGPIHLDLADVYKQMDDAVPTGDRLASESFDLGPACHKALAWKQNGDCATCGSADGFVLTKLALQDAHLTATWVHWFPAGAVAACPIK